MIDFLLSPHGLLISVIILFVLCIQLKSFFSNRGEMKEFKNIFPNIEKLETDIQGIEYEYQQKIQEIEKSDEIQLQNLLRDKGLTVDVFFKTKSFYPTHGGSYEPWQNSEEKIFEKAKAIAKLKDLALKEKENKKATQQYEYASSQSPVFTTIENSIQDYVKANKDGVSDFHLMKDIVDRNCDAKEEEIETQIPVPLYWGLAGTMLGILIGVGFLVFDGSLSALLGNGTGNGAKGVEALLGGVAIAMIASICGIILTTTGSSKFKTVKNVLERNKHTYLSKIQTELLPTLSSDVSSSLVKMSQNLQKFNTTFSKNTTDFGDVLQSVNNASNNVAKTLAAIQSLDITKVTRASVETYEKLKNCTDEIGKLGEYLQGINQYQANTTDAIEKMQKFFSLGIEQIDGINIGVKNALDRFAENSKTYLGSLQEKLDGQILDVNNAVQKQQGELITVLEQQKDELAQYFETISTQMQTTANEQQEMFKQKLNETTALVDELKNLSAVKNSMNELVRQTSSQSQQIEQLTKAIKELAEMKASNKIPIPKWGVIAGIAIGGSIGLAGLVVIVYGVSMLFG